MKWDSDGRAYGGYCREMGFRWSESHFTLPLLCRRKLAGDRWSPLRGAVAVKLNSDDRAYGGYYHEMGFRWSPPQCRCVFCRIDTDGISVRTFKKSGHQAFPLRGRWRRQATDEVRPRSGRAVIASFGEVKFVRRDESAFGVMSTELVIAHSPMPSAWAHLIRHGFAVTPSPRGEGSVAHLNFMSA